MSGFIEGVDRDQVTLFPDRVEDWIDADNLVRVVDLFVDELDLADLGFARASHARTRYHLSALLKLFIYGYLNRVPSSRALEREAGRNVEVMWLMCRLIPDHKTIADFRRDNDAAIRKTCAGFVQICRQIGVLKGDCVAIDGSRFKAVNNRDKNVTKGKIGSRIAHLEAGVDRYLEDGVRIDRQDKGEAREEKIANLAQRYGRIRREIQRLQGVDQASNDAPDGQISLADVDARAMATIEQPALSRISRPRVAQSISTGGANLYFQLVNARYEKTAMILTSNGGFAEWGRSSATWWSRPDSSIASCITRHSSRSRGPATGYVVTRTSSLNIYAPMRPSRRRLRRNAEAVLPNPRTQPPITETG